LSDNLYSPPRTRVEDVSPVQPRKDRPREIVIVVQLAALHYGLGLIALAASWDYYSRLTSTGMLIGNQVVSLALFFWIYYKIYQGRNWARITLLVVTILGCVTTFNSLVMNILMAAPTIVKAQMLIGFVITIAMMWLLFFSRGREWFRREAKRAVA
jgi:hypothetical protein